MSKKLKVGVIGCGSISEHHLNGYANIDGVEIYALCDINEKNLKDRAAKYGVEKTYTDYNEMLKLEELDAVSVCTWNAAHKECTVAALKAGKHVLCEKPTAMNKAEAEEMKKAAEESGKILMIGFVRRHGNDCAVLKDFIDAGDLGDIYYAKATYLRRNGNPGGWFGNKELSGGGPLIDLGVHVIDLVKYLMGNPKPVSVYGVTYQKLFNRPEIKTKKGYTARGGDVQPCNVEDLASALIRFDNGATLSIEASFSLNIKNNVGSIELFGTKGGSKMDPSLEIFTDRNGYLTNVSFDAPTALSFSGLFQNEIDHFVACVRGEAENIAPIEDGVDIMAILDAVYESARTGHEVIL